MNAIRKNSGYFLLSLGLILIVRLTVFGGVGLEAAAQDWAGQHSISDHHFPGLKNNISIDLRGMDIVDVLKFLAIEGGLNIVAHQNVQGQVNLLINDVTVGDTLEILLSMNNLAFVVQENVIKIMPGDVYTVLQGVNFYDARRSVTHQLKYASASATATLLGNIKSDIGKIVFDDSTGVLVLIDTPQKLAEMDDLIQKSDLPTLTRQLPTETRIFELKYAKVEDVLEEISEVLTADVGSVRTDVRTNTLVTTDLPHKLLELEIILEAFDRKTREVFIEAKIVQVTLSDAFKWGIDWDKLFSFDYQEDETRRKFSIKPDISLSPGLTGTFGKLTLNTVGTSNLTAVIEILATAGETKILSNPHIVVEEDQEATINVVTRQPYSQTTTTTTDAATTESTEFVFEEVGVKLSVTPTINSDNFISMKVAPEVSSITSFFPSDTDTNRVPVVETSNAETTVLVKDGITVIIAGMIKDNKTRSVNKIPLLGDLPIIGNIFHNTSDTVTRTETIVFLTPRIITGEIFNPLQRNMEKEIKGLRREES
jgi:type II secretory pathway component GspD/PulD (secretin)